jgi:hypothetical protein
MGRDPRRRKIQNTIQQKMSKAPFEELKRVLEQMTPDYRQKLLGAHKEFIRLRSFCQAKGYIELLPQMRGIKVIEKTEEVKELKKAIDYLKPGNFKWVNEKGEDESETDPRKKAKPEVKTGRRSAP